MDIGKDIFNPGWKKYVTEPCVRHTGAQHTALDQGMESAQTEPCFGCVMSVSHT